MSCRLIQGLRLGSVLGLLLATGLGHAQLPRQDFRVVDYGATPNNAADNDRQSIQNALNAAMAYGGPSRVIFDPGNYHLRSFLTSGPAQGYALQVYDASHDIEIIGGGATIMLVFDAADREGGFMHIRNSTAQVYVRSMDIDYPDAYLPWTEGTIVNDTSDSNPNTIAMQVRAGFPTPNAAWVTAGERHWGYFIDDTVPGRLKANTFNVHYATGAATVINAANRIYRFDFGNANPTRMTDFVVGRRFVYLTRGNHIFKIVNCQNPRLAAINAYGSAGMFVRVDDSTGTLISDCHARIRGASGVLPQRWKGGNADGFNFYNSPGGRILNSSIEGISDDCINFTDSTQGPGITPTPWNFTIDNCEFKNSRRNGILIKAWGGTITNNLVEGVSRSGIIVWNGTGINGLPYYGGDLNIDTNTVDRCAFERASSFQDAPVTVWHVDPSDNQRTAKNLSQRITLRNITVTNAAPPLIHLGNLDNTANASVTPVISNCTLIKGSTGLVARSGSTGKPIQVTYSKNITGSGNTSDIPWGVSVSNSTGINIQGSTQ